MSNTVDTYPAHLYYSETCFISVTDRGMVIQSLEPQNDSEPLPQLYRHELPRGPIGDEMWERLTTGLRLRRA